MPTPAPDLTRLVPGFDFLQGLVKNAGAALPGLPGVERWIAPTLDPEELDKRIKDLRTVQFWLEQNAKLLGATIQALEVQRMTLATLKTLNVPLAGMADALRTRPPTAPAVAVPAPGAAPEDEAEHDAGPGAKPARKAPRRAGRSPAAAAAPAVDPMLWWGALTQQFGELAGRAMKDMPQAATQWLGDGAQAGNGKPAEPGGRAGAPAKQAGRKPSRKPARKAARKATR